MNQAYLIIFFVPDTNVKMFFVWVSLLMKFFAVLRVRRGVERCRLSKVYVGACIRVSESNIKETRIRGPGVGSEN